MQHDGMAVGEIRDVRLVTLETGEMPRYTTQRTGENQKQIMDLSVALQGTAKDTGNIGTWSAVWNNSAHWTDLMKFDI